MTTTTTTKTKTINKKKQTIKEKNSNNKVNVMVKLWYGTVDIIPSEFFGNFLLMHSVFKNLEALDEKSKTKFWEIVDKREKKKAEHLKSLKVCKACKKSSCCS